MTHWKTDLLSRMAAVENVIGSFRERVRSFYFNVLLSKFRCPQCQGQFQVVGPSSALCICGAAFDPTVTFQKSGCCGAILVKRQCHYACSVCGDVVPSIFLFDEAVFDSEYFREKMRLSREERRREQAETRAILRIEKSSALSIIDEVDLGAISGLVTALDDLVGVRSIEERPQDWERNLSIEDYRQHIVNLLDAEIVFSSISPLFPEERRDKVYRFISLIFMEQDREISLSQYGEDILVERR
jgi:hypothetical protein